MPTNHHHVTADFYKGIKPVDDVRFENEIDREDAQDLVMELAALQARIAGLTALADDCKDRIRSLLDGQTGRVQGRDGVSITASTNERFNVKRARDAFKKDPAALAAISTPTPSAAGARKALADRKITAEQYAATLSKGDAVIRVNYPTETTEDED